MFSLIELAHIGAGLIASNFLDDQAMAAPAAQYLRGIGIGLPALIMTGVLAAAIHMDSGRKRVMRAALICTVMNAIIRFCGTVCILFFVFARPIARLYVSEGGELLNMTVFAVRMIALEAPLYGFLRLRIAYLHAVNRTRDMQLLSVLSILIYVVLAADVLGVVFGAYGILAAFPVSDFLSLATVLACCSFKTRKLLPSKSDYRALPENFQLSPGDVILLDIRDEDDVSLVSEQIQMFCKGHGIDRKTRVERRKSRAQRRQCFPLLGCDFRNVTCTRP